MIKLFLLSVLSLACSFTVFAQSKTTEALHEQHNEALALFFYNNTLRMLNQTDDPAFDDLIRDIEKMKFLMIDKSGKGLDYKDLVRDYKTESFEEVMTSRYEGKNFDIFVREKDKKTNGMLVLINDEKNLYVLDIVGSIALNQVTELYNQLDKSADIGRKIKAFTQDGSEEQKNDHSHGDH